MTRLKLAWALGGILLAVGCEGKLTGGNGASSDGPAVGSDGPPVVAGAYRLSGNVTDYDDGSALMAMALETQGLTPQLTATSDAAGAYVFETVPTGSAFFVRAVPGGPGYRATFSQAIVVLDADVTQDVSVVSDAYVQRQYTTAGVIAVPNTSIVIGDLWKPDGTPLDGIPLADVRLTDALDAPVGAGPYFLGPTGDVAPAVTLSATDLSGRVRVAWLNVPTGSHTIKLAARGGPPPGDGLPPGDAALADAAVAIPDAALPADAAVVIADAALLDAAVADGGGGGGGGGGTPTSVPVVCTDNGATLASVKGAGGGGGGVVPEAPLFTADVYPILQRASAGGVGCAGCHTAGGLAGGLLILDDGAGAVHARLTGNADHVNLASPAASLLLSKPLYETPPNHPNAIFLDVSDPGYRTILNWISTGAPL